MNCLWQYMCMFWHKNVKRLQNALKPEKNISKDVTSGSLWNVSLGFVFSPVQVLSNGRLLPVIVQNLLLKHSEWHSKKPHVFYRFAVYLPYTHLIASHLSFHHLRTPVEYLQVPAMSLQPFSIGFFLILCPFLFWEALR